MDTQLRQKAAPYVNFAWEGDSGGPGRFPSQPRYEALSGGLLSYLEDVLGNDLLDIDLRYAT